MKYQILVFGVFALTSCTSISPSSNITVPPESTGTSITMSGGEVIENTKTSVAPVETGVIQATTSSNDIPATPTVHPQKEAYIAEINIPDPAGTKYPITVSTAIQDTAFIKNNLLLGETCTTSPQGTLLHGEVVIWSGMSYCEVMNNRDTYISFLSRLESHQGTHEAGITFGNILPFMGKNRENTAIFQNGATNSSLIHHSNETNDGFIGIEKMFGGDNPGYYLVRVIEKNGKFIYQQAEIIPYALLYDGVNEMDVPNMLTNFDAKLKTAIEKNGTFTSPSFQTRYMKIIETLDSELVRAQL